MPASYVHQCVAAAACDALSLFAKEPLRSAALAGSEGPDPFFFSFVDLPGRTPAPRLGSMLHTQRTDEFLLALCESCQGSELLRAYCCGFMTHYAADTTFHPFVYAHSLTEDGRYSGTLHCTLEHQLETLHYRRQGHETGLPVQMAGFAALSPAQRNEIAGALSAAIARIFPKEAPDKARTRRAFDDAVSVCRLLRSESGAKYRMLGTALSPLKLSAALHAHMMPLTPPDTDIANDAHAPWTSIWQPDIARCDSFDDLFAAAVSRAGELVRSANGLMTGSVSYAAHRTLLGGYSYDSGLPWSASCPAAKAPGVMQK